MNLEKEQYLPYGELFVSQSTNGYDARYKFTGKERDEETGLDYFGARYYYSDGSFWLSVDPMSDKYSSLSPYNYTAWNPVILKDPNGKDIGWYEDENGYTQYDPKINSQKDLTDAGIKGNYKGQAVLGTTLDGHFAYGDEQGNITYSLPEISVDGGKMTEHARVMSNPIVKAVHKGQVALLPDYVGFSISGNAFVGGGFGVSGTLGWVKGDGVFLNASFSQGTGVDISAGLSFSVGNYYGTGTPTAKSLAGLSTYQNLGSMVNITAFQDVSKDFGKLKLGQYWQGYSFNLSLGSKTTWGGSAGTSLTIKPLKL